MNEPKVTDIAAELAGLRRELSTLAVGLTAIVATQETQTDLLRLLLEAATTGDGGESSLSDVLGEIARALSEQSELLEGVRSDLAALPASIAATSGERLGSVNMLTYRLGSEGQLSGARAMAQHVMEVTLPAELAAVASYYARTPGMNPTDLPAFAVTAPIVRADIDPRVADLLGLDPLHPLTEDQLAQILAGRRTDGKPIEGRQTRRYDQSLGDALGLTSSRMPLASEVAHIIGGRRADGRALSVGRADALRGRFLSVFGAGPDASAEDIVRAIERRKRLDGGPLRSAVVLDGLTATRARAAFVDLCWSAPKSLSVAWGLARTESERALLHAAHREAVDRTLAIVEESLGAVRRGQNGRAGRQAGHMAWITCAHYTARPTLAVASCDPETEETFTALTSVPTRGDPQIHTHSLVPAVSLTDGDVSTGGRHVGSPDFQILSGNIHRWGRTYAAFLATALRRIGVAVSLDPRTGMARLDAVPNVLCELFSRRSAQGEAAARAYAKAQGLDWNALDGPRRIGLLKGATQGDKRAGKTDAIGDPAAWQAEAAALGWTSLTVLDLDRPQPLAPQAERLETAYRAAAPLLAGEFRTSAVLDQARVSVAAAAGLIEAGIQDGSEVDAVTRLILDRGIVDEEDAVPLISHSVRGQHGKAAIRLTTGGHVDREARLIRLVREAAADQTLALTTEAVDVGMREAGLVLETAHGQAQLVVARALGRSKFQAATGVAGSGKSALLSGLVRGWQAQQRTVMGTATAWRQATALQDAGIAPDHTYALAALLARVRAATLEISASTVLVIDEVALLSVRDLLALLEIRTATGCTLVAVGDPAQGGAIQAGGVISLLEEALGKLPSVGSSVRQRSICERELAALARSGDAAAVLDTLRDQDRAWLIPGPARDVAEAAARLWIERRAACQGETPLVLVPTNGDARLVNAAIRARLQAASEIGRDILEIDAISLAGEQYAMPLAVGDAVRLYRRTYATGSRGVVGVNGTVASVMEIRRDGLVLRVATGREAFVRWDGLREETSGRLLLGPGLVTTLAAGQGATAESALTVFPHGVAGVRAGGFYVGMSRHRAWCAVLVGESAERRAIAQRRSLLDARPIRAAEIWAHVAASLSRRQDPETATQFLARAHEARRKADDAFRIGLMRLKNRDLQGAAPTTLPARVRIAALGRSIPAIARILAERTAGIAAIAAGLAAVRGKVGQAISDHRLRADKRRPTRRKTEDRLALRR